MTMFRQRKYLVAAALLLAFAGCKGESPTAPTSTTGGGGTTVPPSTAAVALTVSNPTPLTTDTTVFTATVTQNGQPVPNGTAVEFTTSKGTFTEANAATEIRTTTNGIATATLASTSAGAATVTATVANVQKSITITFSAPVTPPPPVDTTPGVTSIAPTTGRPQGGETVTINGKNFRTPLRVLFDFGAAGTKEAFVVSATATQIQVLTPAIDLGVGQTAKATITVINEAGTANEVRVTGQQFTYQTEVLTPKIQTVSPASGPIDGGTRVTIFGEAFQAPVQVFFGSAEAQVLNVSFSQITVIAPVARDTSPNGSGTVTGPIDIRVLNINSGTSATLSGVFRYVAKMQITSVSPTEGSFTGGTRVTIDGIGFNDPVAVVIGGIAAQVVQVSGSRVVAVSSPFQLTTCVDVVGPISVTNIDNGDTATAAATFKYRVPAATIVAATPSVTAGGTITVSVLNAYGIPRLTLGSSTLNITGQTDGGGGVTVYTATVPTTIESQLKASSCGGPIATSLSVGYKSATLECLSSSIADAVIVNPAQVPKLSLEPATGFKDFTAKFTPATFTETTAGTPPVTTRTWVTNASVTQSAAQTVSIVNTGAASLVINSVDSSSCGASWVITAPAGGTTLAQCDTAPVMAVYKGAALADAHQLAPYTPAPESCSITISTNGGTKTLQLVGQVQ